MGNVKDFENTGYSFVAKKNNEVVGVIMAQKIMDYGNPNYMGSVKDESK